MNTPRIITTLALLAALAACKANRSDDADPPPDPQASETPTPAPTESILRPEVEAEQGIAAAIPLEPLELTIGFPDGEDELGEAALTALRNAVGSAQVKAGGPIVLGGHSDTSGSDAVNLRASTARAEIVRDWLVEQGIDEARIEIIAFGEQNPIEPNALPDGSPNEEGRAANRRVEISVVPPEAGSQPEAAGPEDASVEAGD